MGSKIKDKVLVCAILLYIIIISLFLPEKAHQILHVRIKIYGHLPVSTLILCEINLFFRIFIPAFYCSPVYLSFVDVKIRFYMGVLLDYS